MTSRLKTVCFFVLLFSNVFSEEKKNTSPTLTWENGGLEIGYLNRIEGFYSRRLFLFSDSIYDQQLYFQNTTDFKFYVHQGDAIRSRLVVRNKFRIAEPESLGVVSSTAITIADALNEGNHNHYVGKLFLWLREAWFEVSLKDVLSFESTSKHFLKIGLFPFSLGRGISLSDAYLTSPGAVGFYSSNVIDQYAFGTLLHGELFYPNLIYDLYFGFLRNFSGSLRDIVSKIYAPDFEISSPYRGFGKVNLVFASHVVGTIENPIGFPGKATIEPYFMINSDPEQTIEFNGDAASKLATLGFALEYEGEKFSWSLETSANFGHQTVRAWDRNSVVIGNDNGVATFQYTKVNVGDADGDPAPVTDANKSIVNKAPKSAIYNGQEIGTSSLFNATDRFTNGYVNTYKGYMFVADLTARLKKNVKLSTAIAFASGDLNPNADQLSIGDSNFDGDYKGFIPFQSNYSGKSVVSVFFLGTGKIVRPSNSLAATLTGGSTPNVESGFTNLILYGIGSDMLVESSGRKARIRPNIIFGMNAIPFRKFDVTLVKALDSPADRYLGFEINVFAESELLKNLKTFIVAGVFFPGAHYNDVRGKPLTPQQLAFITAGKSLCGDNLFDKNNLPLLDNKKAFVINIGLEYFF